MVLSAGFFCRVNPAKPVHPQISPAVWRGGKKENGAGQEGGRGEKTPLRFQGLSRNFAQTQQFRGPIRLDLLGLPMQRTGHLPGQVWTVEKKALPSCRKRSALLLAIDLILIKKEVQEQTSEEQLARRIRTLSGCPFESNVPQRSLCTVKLTESQIPPPLASLHTLDLPQRLQLETSSRDFPCGDTRGR